MAYVGIALTIAACAVGLLASYLWLKSAGVKAVPLWAQLGVTEPVEPATSQAHQLIGLLRAAEESARLNQQAALWTAVAVLLSALASLQGQGLFG